MNYSIQNMVEEERPRERLLRHGPEAMSSAELVAIILGSGIKGTSVLQLSQQLLMHFGSLQRLAEATIEELCQIKGLGVVKAIQLKASISLGMRASRQAVSVKYRIDSPIHAYHLVKDELMNEKRELFLVILLDVKGFVISHEIVSIGTLSNSLIHPREVFYPAVRHKAASMILVHNHPSGDPAPSKQDYEVTQTLIDVGKLMSIPVNDHLVVGQNAYISLRQQGFSF
jgi:DNA repair protein RadC